VQYVFDASAIVSVQLCSVAPNVVLAEMARRLNAGGLCFCNEVLDELERLARDEAPLAWAVASASSRANKGAPYKCIAWVAEDFKAIVDETARSTQEPAALYAVAQALDLKLAKREITVVTEDVRTKPTRASVKDACDHFDIRCIDLEDYIEEVGL
jgi:hypothetical protein